jgi:hypothetical protein
MSDHLHFLLDASQANGDLAKKEPGVAPGLSKFAV